MKGNQMDAEKAADFFFNLELSDDDLFLNGISRADADKAADLAIAALKARDAEPGWLNRIVPRIDAGGPNPIDEVEHCCEWTLHKERERIHHEIGNYTSPQSAPAPAVPEGWQLVPVDITPDMWEAAEAVTCSPFNIPRAIYAAMLAAAPTAGGCE